MHLIFSLKLSSRPNVSARLSLHDIKTAIRVPVLNKAVFVSLYANAIEKGMNQTLLHSAVVYRWKYLWT